MGRTSTSYSNLDLTKLANVNVNANMALHLIELHHSHPAYISFGKLNYDSSMPFS